MRAGWKEKAILLGPTVAWLVAFSVFPLLYTLDLAFRQWSIFTRENPPWVGFENFRNLLFDGRFWSSLKTTLLYVGSSVTAEVILGVGLALLLWQPVRGSRIFRAIVVVPMLLSPVVAGYLFRMLFHETAGPLNHLLAMAGLGRVNWLSDPSWALAAAILVDVWQWTPFVGILALAALESLPAEPLEAARVDGAGNWHLFRHVILPAIAHVVWVAAILRMVDGLRVFDVIFVLTHGGPGVSTEVASLYTYLVGFKSFNLSYAAAMSYGLVLIALGLVRFLARGAGVTQHK